MASISTNKTSGIRRIIVQVGDHRRTIGIGLMRMKSAIWLRDLAQDLADCVALGKAIDPDLVEKVRRLSPDIHDQLSRVGLVRGIKRRINLSDVLARFIVGRKMNDGTIKCYLKVITNLKSQFTGAFSDIGPDEAQAFQTYLKNTYAAATASRRIKACRTIWQWAIENDLGRENPWKGVKAGSQTNSARKEYVPAETVKGLIDIADDEMKLVLSLSRFCGLRVPSEIKSLRWEDIDLREGTMRISSVKTMHHQGHEERYIPIFHQARAIIEKMHKGQGDITSGMLSTNTLRKRLLDLCKKAGVKPWKKLWHNMRASCETDLMSDHDSHVVAKWLGHSMAIAEKHYLTVPPKELEKATRQRAHAGAIKIEHEVIMKPVTDWNSSSFNGSVGPLGPKRRRIKAELKRAYAETGNLSITQKRAQLALAHAYNRVLARKNGGVK